MGTPIFAVPILKSLYQNGYQVSVVYTQPPQKSQRGQKINKSLIQSLSETLNIKFRTPLSLKNNREEYEYLKKLDADLGIVVAYGQIIPNEILNLTKKGFINIHASLLPKWRGAAPIQRSIINLDQQTGITIMKINNKLDSGPICNSYKIDISNNENAEIISNKLSLLGAEKILDNIDKILDDKIEKSEGKINWNNKAENIIGKINGLYPSPGAWFIYKGERFKILKAEISEGKGKPGIILNEYFKVACNNKSIKILEIQRQGKRPQKINEFMLGSQIKVGSNLNNA